MFLSWSKYQIVLPEDLHPLVVAVESFEPALCDLHQKNVVFIVVVQLLMMIPAKITPKSPFIAEPSVCGPVHHVMLMESFMWKLGGCVQAA